MDHKGVILDRGNGARGKTFLLLDGSVFWSN